MESVATFLFREIEEIISKATLSDLDYFEAKLLNMYQDTKQKRLRKEKGTVKGEPGPKNIRDAFRL